MVDIYVEEINPKWKKHAKAELEELFAEFESLEVIITKNFDSTVTEYLQRRGVTEPYESARAGGEVVACKVMHYPSNDQLATCLVINGNAKFFSIWKGGWAKIKRMHCLVHEREHVLLDQACYRRIGHKRFFSNPTSTIECMSKLAHDISSEYIAERKATVALQDASKGELTSYFSGRSKELNGILSSYLESFQLFLTEKINLLRLRRITVDDFWGHIYLRTRDTLNALALLVACTHAVLSTSLEFESIKCSSTFKNLFEDTWNHVESVLVLLYDNQNDCQENLRSIAAIFQNLFLRFGIELRDSAHGMAVYLTRSAPI